MKNNEKKTCKVERRILLDAFFYNALLATFLLDECTATLSLLGFVNSSSMAFGQKGEGQSVFELPGTIFFDGKSYTVTSIESIFGLKMDKIIIPGSVKHVEERAFLSEAGRLRQIEVSDEALLNYVMIPEGVEVVTETFQIEDLRDLPDYRLTSNKDGHVLEFKMKPHMSVVGCRKMEDVAYLTIPSVVSGISVTEIGEGAFSECDDLEEIVIQDISLLKDADVPEGVKIFNKKGVIAGVAQSLLDHIDKNSKKEEKE